MRRKPSSPAKMSLRVADERLVAADCYRLSFEAERFYRGCRYHWMICSVHNPEELVSWGHAPTRQMAEMAADIAVANLESDSPIAQEG